MALLVSITSGTVFFAFLFISLNSNFKTRNYDPDDGIYFYDLSTKENKQIIKFRELDGFRSPIDYRQSVNYLEYLTFSPDVRKFYSCMICNAREATIFKTFLYDFASATPNLLHYSGRGRILIG